MTKPNFEQNLEQQLQALPQEQQPQRDLWQGIEHALDHRAELSDGEQANANVLPSNITSKSSRPLQSKVWLASAASIVMVAMLAWFGGQQYSHYQMRIESEQFIATLSDNYLSQKDMLLVQFKGKPAFTDNWQDQLQELEDAAKAIHEALQHDPRNPTLLKMLKSIYQQQLQLIERVHVPRLAQI
ncbi:hypothetical protein K0504_12565 [Neiella marina]|uniref:Uncharacterized protein n=1 Tax=Neiella holothuriorum TaxID=2870530 RepID=A0ABS7EHP3_9GAMM|nr:hypothetical protein [Neiella holothuriorum]MBW8191871.1 hypothetical protein [Neiella holothuriorum]